ncbi:MAG TPA: vanadium-dependent haloperoxidase [Thermoanaerobaculia bacterium]|nr:vanadium-dependent haloperoxidase [Thermoanaerobaculia bacterium]
MRSAIASTRVAFVVGAASLLVAPRARADAVTDWNQKLCDIVVAASMTPAAGTRVVAIVQTAVYEAVNAITTRYPSAGPKVEASPKASVDAAVAAAAHDTLSKLTPSQQAAIDSAYQAALATIPDGPSRSDGIAVGEKAAAAVLAARAEDGAQKAESYRPQTAAGVYVSTNIPIASQWPDRKPWLMTSADQFRPGPPPKLTSELWARDYNEIKSIGSKNSTQRTAEQTAIAKFWETTQPPIYQGLLRSAASAPQREITRNARLFAAAGQALDDSYIAIFDAKYHYNFWRPITAIRNGDIDGNDATERDASWLPFIDTPPHPEYPCAHCILAAAVSVVLQAEFSPGAVPPLSTTSATAGGASRSWNNLDDFVQEVSNARIYDGVHFRNSTEVGTAMGKKVGALAVAKFLKPSR